MIATLLAMTMLAVAPPTPAADADLDPDGSPAAGGQSADVETAWLSRGDQLVVLETRLDPIRGFDEVLVDVRTLDAATGVQSSERREPLLPRQQLGWLARHGQIDTPAHQHRRWRIHRRHVTLGQDLIDLRRTVRQRRVQHIGVGGPVAVIIGQQYQQLRRQPRGQLNLGGVTHWIAPFGKEIGEVRVQGFIGVRSSVFGVRVKEYRIKRFSSCTLNPKP